MEKVLDANIQVVRERELRKLIAITDKYEKIIKGVGEAICGNFRFYTTETLKVGDYSYLRQLARQELIRRGLTA